MFRKLAILALAALLLAPRAVVAAGLPKATEPVILAVTGAITNTNAGNAAEFDLSMLEGLNRRDTLTATPWYDTDRTFSGPLISAVLEAVGARGMTMRVTAINDYTVDIPVADASQYPVILATRVDGQLMSVREKGPLFVIYPFDEEPDLFNEMYFGRSVWQVRSIDVF